ncbi:MAG: NUDIX hydrolase [Methyloligellaceae bacterium]
MSADETEPPRLGASAAIFHDGRVLIGERSKPTLDGIWSLPGGHIEAGETARQAAERELLEETGVRADLIGVADVTDVMLRAPNGEPRQRYRLTVFYGLWRAGEASPGDDCRAVRWVDPAALDAVEMTEGTAAIIRKAQALLQRS